MSVQEFDTGAATALRIVTWYEPGSAAPSSAARFDQFAELERRVAPTYGCVTADPDEAIASLTRLRSELVSVRRAA